MHLSIPKYRLYLYTLTLILGLSNWLFARALFNNNIEKQIEEAMKPLPVFEFKNLPPILIAIANCESGDRQFNKDGSVIQGRVNPLDTGKFQINLKYWGAKAEELGYDLSTEDGNTRMALYIYKHYGTDPWFWSSGCWNQ